jgi:hypothetical protein
MHAGISKTGSTSATSCWFGKRARPLNVVGRLPLLFSTRMLPANGDTNRRKQPRPMPLFAHSDHTLSPRPSARTRISPGSGPLSVWASCPSARVPRVHVYVEPLAACASEPIPTW